jgi:hypothetical protein
LYGACTTKAKAGTWYARELTVAGSLINPYTHDRAVDLLTQMGLQKLHIDSFRSANSGGPSATGDVCRRTN